MKTDLYLYICLATIQNPIDKCHYPDKSKGTVEGRIISIKFVSKSHQRVTLAETGNGQNRDGGQANQSKCSCLWFQGNPTIEKNVLFAPHRHQNLSKSNQNLSAVYKYLIFRTERNHTEGRFTVPGLLLSFIYNYWNHVCLSLTLLGALIAMYRPTTDPPPTTNQFTPVLNNNIEPNKRKKALTKLWDNFGPL